MNRGIVLFLFVFIASSPIGLIVPITNVSATPILYDWAFNDNGTIFSAAENSPADLGSSFDYSNFDWDSGLGTITVSYDVAGDYSFTSFFDHETVQEQNTYHNESGEVIGSPQAGQSWEIDEPGWEFGDIYDNTLAGQLDNSNGTPTGWEGDVSMALGWEFSLLENQIALLTLSLSELVPTGFFLAHNDPDGSFYFTSSLSIDTTVAPVPEPGTILLMGTGLAGLAGLRRRKRSR